MSDRQLIQRPRHDVVLVAALDDIAQLGRPVGVAPQDLRSRPLRPMLRQHVLRISLVLGKPAADLDTLVAHSLCRDTLAVRVGEVAATAHEGRDGREVVVGPRKLQLEAADARVRWAHIRQDATDPGPRPIRADHQIKRTLPSLPALKLQHAIFRRNRLQLPAPLDLPLHAREQQLLQPHAVDFRPTPLSLGLLGRAAHPHDARRVLVRNHERLAVIACPLLKLRHEARGPQRREPRVVVQVERAADLDARGGGGVFFEDRDGDFVAVGGFLRGVQQARESEAGGAGADDGDGDGGFWGGRGHGCCGRWLGGDGGWRVFNTIDVDVPVARSVAGGEIVSE